MAKSPWLGLVGIAGGLVFLAIPRSETYGDYGLGINEVEVNCGNSFDSKVDPVFENSEEEYYYSPYDAIFDGKTAEEVCRKVDGDARPLGWGAVGLGALWLVVGLAMASSSKQSAGAPQFPPVNPPRASNPARPPASQSATAGGAKVANPARWLPDPMHRYQHRYWDGSKWTEHVAKGSVVTIDPISDLNTAHRPDKRLTSDAAGPSAKHLPAPIAAVTPEPSALAVPPPPPTGPGRHGTSAPPPPADHDGRTLKRSSLRTGARLRFDDGSTLDPQGPVLIGRQPAAAAGEVEVSLHPIVDHQQSVSKTHLLVEPTETGLRITDRHSANGTEVMIDGVQRAVTPLVPVDAPFGSTVQFGERKFSVERLAT